MKRNHERTLITRHARRPLWVAALFSMALAPWTHARAEATDRAAAADPLNAAAPVPAVTHRSELRRFRSIPDAEIATTTWGDANRTVNAVGGWRTYAKEKAPADRGAPVAAPPAGKTGHEGHATHKPN